MGPEAHQVRPKQATRYDGRKTEGWHYFQIDIRGTPSLISLREEIEGRASIHNLIEKSEYAQQEKV